MYKEKRKQLLYEINKTKILNKVEKLNFFKNTQIIEPLAEWENALKKVIKIDYPTYKLVDFSQLNADYINNIFDFTNNDEIILPYFEESSYWVKAILNNKFDFIKYLLYNKLFNNFCIISLANNKLYDFTLDEQFYNLYILQI